MDQEIEEQEGMKISGIFRLKGEDYFRAKEKVLTTETVMGNRAVVATGGGTWMDEENRDRLLQGGWCVWLDASPEVVWERVRSQLPDRPLLASSRDPLRTIQELLNARNPLYASAHVRVETTGLTPEAVAERIEKLLRKDRPFDLPEL